MKTVKDKQILMAADFAGYPLKEAIKEYLEKKGWTVTDIGVKADSDPNDTELMFHRIGLRVGAMITEKEFERALIFCGTGMGIHIAASKCPGVHAGVVESVPAAFRAITGNGVNVLAMGAFYVTPELGKQCADAYLYNDFASGWEWWPDFDKFHQDCHRRAQRLQLRRVQGERLQGEAPWRLPLRTVRQAGGSFACSADVQAVTTTSMLSRQTPSFQLCPALGIRYNTHP